ncbi:MAG TPA: GNAT family protein [Methanofastidiosum sp.]|nr:GNAT family protein [Methanofastidiosum sp.]
MIKGKLVYLTEMDQTHSDHLRKLRNNPEINKFLFSRPFINDLQQKIWFENISRSSRDLYMIITDTINNFKGVIYLNNIDLRNGTAEWGYFLDPESRFSGEALEAEFLFTKYAFDYLRLNKLYCITLEENPKVLSAHERFGYIVEGNFKDHYFLDGVYKNAIFMSLFKKNFEENSESLQRIIDRLGEK